MERIREKVKIVVAILLVILLSVIAFLGVFKKDKGVWNNLVPDYKYAMDISGTRELKYVLDDTEEEKYVYVDENGETIGEVWKDGSGITEEDEKSSEEEGQAEEATEENTETENAESTAENTESNENEETDGLAKETRTIKANEDSSLTKENFEKAKNIIQKRLQIQDVGEYNIRLDDVTGKLSVETTNNADNVDLIGDLVTQQGKFQVKDYQNGKILMDNSDIKNATVLSSNRDGYTVYLQIEFDKEGAQKLKEISNEYVEIKNEDTENTEENSSEEANPDNETEEEATAEEEETEKKYVSIIFDDTTMMTTYFGEEMSGGLLQISVGNSTNDYDKFLENYDSAKVIADILNSGTLPISYELENDNFVKSDFNAEVWRNIIIGLVIVASIIFIIKFKAKGVFASVLEVGFIAAFSLINRYTNVTVSINALIIAIVIAIMNYVFMYMLLNRMKEKSVRDAFNETMKIFYLSMIPVIIVAIIFTLVSNIAISSIGMVLFWGLSIIALYNFIFTRSVFVNTEVDKK